MLHCQFCYPTSIFSAALGAGRVVQIIDNENLCFSGYGLLKLVDIKGEIGLPGYRSVRNCHTTMKLYLGFVDGKSWIRIEYLISGVHHGQQKFGNYRLTAGLDRNIYSGIRSISGPVELFGQRFPKLDDADVGGISGFPIFYSPAGSLGDMLGGCQVEVAQMKRIDPVARGGMSGRLTGHDKGGLNSKVSHPVGKREYVSHFQLS